MPRHHAIHLWYEILLFVLYWISSENAASSSNFSFSSIGGPAKFNNLVVDENSGEVFIGAVNILYQLSPELNFITSYTTSTNSNLPNCFLSDYLSNKEKKLDNFNKALVIDYANSRLIACGSNFQGICTIHDIKNISNMIVTSCEPVVAKNEKATTIAFISHADSKNTNPNSALYVGVTYPGNSTHQSELPAISSRSLDNRTLFKIIKQNNTNGANISLNPQYVDSYPIKYVYGFSRGSFNYFLTIQKNSTKEPYSYITKIIRMCDKKDNSYIEIPMQCKGKHKNIYNLVQAAFLMEKRNQSSGSLDNISQDLLLYVIFAQGKQLLGEKSNEPQDHNALCVYSLSEIDSKFIQNAVHCVTGDGYLGPKFIPPEQPCTKMNNFTIDPDFCWLNVKIPIGGKDPVKSSSSFEIDKFSTAISVTSTGKFTVVFVGTHRGFLKKFVLKDRAALEYDESQIGEGSAVISLQFDRKKENLYVMTQHKLIRIPVQICLTYETDQDCIESGDPYCGWCLPQNSCTLLNECIEAQDNPLLWIPYNIQALISISMVSPKIAPIHYVTNLTLTVKDLPSFNETLFCEFTIWNQLFITNGTKINYELNCPTPNLTHLSPTPKGHGTPIKVKLSIRTRNITDLAHKKYTFYDCNEYNFCSLCVNSTKCFWLVNESKCVYNIQNHAYEQLKKGPIYKSEDCPSTEIISNNKSLIFLLPDGAIQSLIAEAHNFHHFPAGTEYHCQFEIEGKVVVKNATLNDATISCDEMEFTYSTQQPNIDVEFQVWRNTFNHSIDIPRKMFLFLYQCRLLANNRSSCLALDEEYKCGWCNSTNHCELITGFNTNSEDELLENCDVSLKSPFLYFQPKLGLFEGSTYVFIQNVRWNYSFKEIKNAITVAGIPCTPLKNLDIQNGVIKCQMNETSLIPHNNVITGPVEVKIGNYSSHSKDNFTIVDPKITDFFPKQGWWTGDIELTITGIYLNAVKNVEVFINELPCMVFAKSHSTLKCMTTPATWSFRGYVAVNFDGKKRVFEKFLYEAKYNSNLTLKPNNDFVPKGTPQGGNQILLHGTNFTQILNASINVTLHFDQVNQTKFYSSDCKVYNDSVMGCLSPSIPDMMDYCSTKEVRNPILLGYTVIATISNENKQISSKCLRLKYPKFVLYCNCEHKPKSLLDRLCSLEVIVTLIMMVMMVILVSASLILFKKLTKSRKARKKIQDQIDKLELCVAAECKEAFAELQTEISVSRVCGMPENLPFWDYSTYVMKILFPNIHDHSTILCGSPELTNKKKELQMFNQLITNKTFLLVFIQTLEKEESFSMNDRVYIGSMLMISLKNEMEYCTDIIETLLVSLIGKSMKRPSQPKLLLRRTESVIEKMISTWFSFLLYRFLLECVGEPLFTLYKGIKQQVSRGPIDEFTSEAKYSLNECKLIRQHITYASITVLVSVPQQTAADTGLISAVDNVPIKMLDCDTISQAKEKAVNGIYFAVNYSKRPKPSELDLESVTELSGSMILFDNDFSSEIDGEWRRRNTLQHYGINDGSMLKLVLTKTDENLIPTPSMTLADETEQISFPCEELRSTFIKCASPKPCRARFLSIPDIDAYYKEWHLVKPTQLNDHTYRDNMVSEVYLTRLLSTKGTLQKFVDNLFEIIFSATRQNTCFPIAIKYMFDFLDDQACKHGITDPQIVHTWKNNCLPLRFWVNLIKNPDFLFDIHKSDVTDSSLSVVAQAFMDSCSISEHPLGKDSPTAKLLYAKDIPFYREWVKKYYSDIRAMPPVSRDDMSAMLGKESQLHCMDFNTNAAVYELFKYAVKYKEKLMVALRENQLSQKYNLVSRLEEILPINTTTAG